MQSCTIPTSPFWVPYSMCRLTVFEWGSTAFSSQRGYKYTPNIFAKINFKSIDLVCVKVLAPSAPSKARLWSFGVKMFTPFPSSHCLYRPEFCFVLRC